MRKPLSNKQRFDIFKRDGFTCQYCGANGENVKLQVDHIEPVSKGGKCEAGNFITSCRQCNIGKAANPVLPEVITYNPEDFQNCQYCDSTQPSSDLFYFRVVSNPEPLNLLCRNCVIQLLFRKEVNDAWEDGYKTAKTYCKEG